MKKFTVLMVALTVMLLGFWSMFLNSGAAGPRAISCEPECALEPDVVSNRVNRDDLGRVAAAAELQAKAAAAQKLTRDAEARASEAAEKEGIAAALAKIAAINAQKKADEEAAAANVPTWRPLAVDWQDTQLGPGYPDIIPSAWSDLGVISSGDVLRIEADGFNDKASVSCQPCVHTQHYQHGLEGGGADGVVFYRGTTG